MNLGYLMIPQNVGSGTSGRGIGRATLARNLGFSEFYAVEHRNRIPCSCALNALPENADFLRTMAEAPEKPALQVAALNGERQSPRDLVTEDNRACPSATLEHVSANARQRKATLSVSWMNKIELAQHWGAQVVGSTHAGVRARPDDWRIARTILVSNDPARAKAAVESQSSPCRAYYSKIAGSGASSKDVDELMKGCVLFGTLRTVLEELHDISATSAPFGTLTLVDHAWPDVELADQSLAALAASLAPMMSRRASN